MVEAFGSRVGVPGRDSFMRSDSDRVGDILEAITKIRARGASSFDQFLADEMVQV